MGMLGELVTVLNRVSITIATLLNLTHLMWSCPAHYFVTLGVE